MMAQARGLRLAVVCSLLLFSCLQSFASTSTLRGAYWESDSFLNDVSSSYGVPQELAMLRQQQAQQEAMRRSAAAFAGNSDGQFHPTRSVHRRPGDVVKEPAFVETIPVVTTPHVENTAVPGPFDGANGGPFGVAHVSTPPQATTPHHRETFESPSFAEVMDQIKEAIKYPKGMHTDPRQPHSVYHRVGRPPVAPPADPPRPYDHPQFSGILPLPRASHMTFGDPVPADASPSFFEERLRIKSQQLKAQQVAKHADVAAATAKAAKAEHRHSTKKHPEETAVTREALLEEFSGVKVHNTAKDGAGQRLRRAGFELPPLVDVSDEDRQRAFHHLRRVD